MMFPRWMECDNIVGIMLAAVVRNGCGKQQQPAKSGDTFFVGGSSGRTRNLQKLECQWGPLGP